MTWRDEAARVLRETDAQLPAEATFAQVRKAYRAAYPFGERACFPYKVWCEEQEFFLRRRFPRIYGPIDRQKLVDAAAAVGQELLFLEEKNEI